jgi:hypothetical protein
MRLEDVVKITRFYRDPRNKTSTIESLKLLIPPLGNVDMTSDELYQEYKKLFTLRKI